MALLLRLTTTGKTYSVRESCLLPKRGEEKLALVYAVAGVWCLSPLNPLAADVRYNGRELTRGQILAVGDELLVAGQLWSIEALDPVDEPRPATASLPGCRVVVSDGIQVVTRREMVIGSAASCSLCLSADAGVQPLHALLTPLAGRWTLQALSGAGIESAELGLVKAVDIDGGERVRLGDQQVLFTLTDRTDSSWSADSHPSSDNVSGAALVGVLGAEEPLPRRCAEIVQALLADQLARVVPVPKPSLLGRLTGLVRRQPNDLFSVLDRLALDLVRRPTRRDAWLNLARFLEAEGQMDLCRLVLERMVALRLHDEGIVVSLVRLYLELARDTARTREERLHYCGRAERLAGKLLQRAPDRDDFADLQRRSASERSILDNDLEARLY